MKRWSRPGTTTASWPGYRTPHITGLVARLLAKHPGLTIFQVKTVLRALSANVLRRTAEPRESSMTPLSS